MRARSSQPARVDRSFERLYRKHAQDVYRYALGVLANPTDAEDVTQTAFLNAYRAFRTGTRPERPLTWLIAITHNVCRQRFRQSARRPKEVALDIDALDIGAQDEQPAAADIKVAFNQLTFNQRSALTMRELEGRSYAEIADVLDLSLSAVETLIFRARRALREQLESMLSCTDAERAISRQLDGTLERADKGRLRAHLRACPECASIARKVRAQRSALRSMLTVPLTPSLTGLFGGSTATGGLAGLGSGLALKVAALAGVAVFASGVGYESASHHPHRSAAPAAPAARPQVEHAVARQFAAVHAVDPLPAAKHHPKRSAEIVRPRIRPQVRPHVARTDHTAAPPASGASSHAAEASAAPVLGTSGQPAALKPSVQSTHPNASARRTTHAPPHGTAKKGSTKARATGPASTTPAPSSNQPVTHDQQGRSASTQAPASPQQLPSSASVSQQAASSLAKQTPAPAQPAATPPPQAHPHRN